MEIRKTTIQELDVVMELYARARRFMQEHGNPDQWGSTYPPREQIEEDIADGKSYVCTEQGELLGVFYFAVEDDPDYRQSPLPEPGPAHAGEPGRGHTAGRPVHSAGGWLGSGPYGVMHRVAAPGKRRGVATFCVNWCFAQSGGDLRIDTHRDNLPMQGMLEKNGFIRCGIIYIRGGDERIAYEKRENG